MDKILVGLSKKYGLQPIRKASPSSTVQTSLPPSLLLLAPTFPTFTALATVADRPPDVGRKGLFLELVGDPRILLQDLLDSPAKYEEGVSSLLQDLVSGRRKFESLLQSESEQLDRATIDFTHPERRQEVAAPPKVINHPVEHDGSYETEEGDSRYPSPQVPELNGLEPYWWLR